MRRRGTVFVRRLLNYIYYPIVNNISLQNFQHSHYAQSIQAAFLKMVLEYHIQNGKI